MSRTNRQQPEVRISRRLSFILRHQPESVGLALDPQGWVEIDALLGALRLHGLSLDRERLDHVVATNDKARFEVDEAGTRIRARQGHSRPIDLDLAPADPPPVLYHGTVDRFLDPIRAQGLTRQKRHHVHLSADLETARKVGERRGRPVVLKVDAAAMVAAGHRFFVTGNGVWLTETVPAVFLGFP